MMWFVSSLLQKPLIGNLRRHASDLLRDRLLPMEKSGFAEKMAVKSCRFFNLPQNCPVSREFG